MELNTKGLSKVSILLELKLVVKERIFILLHLLKYLMIHMIALTVVRIIQNKIVSFKVKDTTKNWKMELSGERLTQTLNSWTFFYILIICIVLIILIVVI